MREKLIDLFNESLFADSWESNDYPNVEAAVDYLMANGVTIPVRCKECKYLYDELDDYCCTSHRGLVRICENSFCSYGERRTDG